MSPLSGSVRAVLASLLALPLALLSGAHAFSSASLRYSPDLALTVFPYNGLAKERVAYQSLVAGVQNAAGASDSVLPDSESGSPFGSGVTAADLMSSAGTASATARGAIKHEPLSARAYVILALADQDPLRMQRIIDQASRLTRRDIVLQTLVLKQRGEVGDYAGAIDTLDEILRVHPERKSEFFPLLVKALGNEATVPEFAKLLGKALPWRDSFLNFALTDQKALENLAAVRERIATDDKDFDRKLIARLIDTGQVLLAERLYRKASGASAAEASTAASDWVSKYPPFDWKLADQAGFRAQVSNRSDILEFEVTPGNGGVIASRLVRNPGRPFTMGLTHDIEPTAQTKDMKLTIACSGQSDPFYEAPFAQRSSSFFADKAQSCRYLVISIWARAWTDAQALSGTLRPIAITER